MIKLIDPHIHLFDLDKGCYHWLAAESPPHWPDKQIIHRNYGELDLQLNAPFSLEGFVHIEAGFDNDAPWREIEWLEEQVSRPFKSIAYVDLTSPDFSRNLEKVIQYPSVIGVRNIFDDHECNLLSEEPVRANLALLEQKGLLFEVQLSLSSSESVAGLSSVMSAFPQLQVILNHSGMPENLSETWMQNIMQLAQYPECYIKCSGWEMFNREWNIEKVKPLINFAIRQFGLTRVMLASNFPVSELGCPYAELWRRYMSEMKLKRFEQDMLFFENAKRIYGFDG